MPTSSLTGLSPSEIFNKIRRIEIKTSRLVNELFGGRYLSSFKGRGMEFNDIREYIPGDDIRDIHWNVTARLGHPYVKRFTEERELTILLAVDVSRSHAFGTHEKFKMELAAELVALLSFASLKNNDKVGLLLFSDIIESYIPPRKSKSHTLRLVRDVLGFKPQRVHTDLEGALQYLNRVQKKRSIVFLISDFLDAPFEKSLGITKRKHDTIAFILEDPMETQWPDIGNIIVEDAETGQTLWVNPGRDHFREKYEIKMKARKAERDQIFSKLNIDRVNFITDQDYVKPLMTFFQERAKRIRR